jgi:anti-sigma factor RsiW
MTASRLCDDKAALVAWLYGEGSEEERARMAAHLAACPACRAEAEALRAVRGQLAAWAPPDLADGFAVVGRTAPRRPWSRALGAPLMAAAAILLLAVAAAVANLEIRYDQGGFAVRTGWAEARSARAEVGPATPTSSAPWRDDLMALERRLRAELAAARATVSPAVDVSTAIRHDREHDELLRQIRVLVEQSERRQRRELALRLAAVVRDFDLQRQTDLLRIQQGLGQLEGYTAADRQLLNYVLRVAQPR